MSMKPVLTLTMLLCLSAVASSMYHIDAPVANSSHYDNAKIATSGTGDDNSTGVVKIEHGGVSMGSHAISLGEETMWQHDFEAPTGNWQEGAAQVVVSKIVNGNQTVHHTVAITIVSPD